MSNFYHIMINVSFFCHTTLGLTNEQQIVWQIHMLAVRLYEQRWYIIYSNKVNHSVINGMIEMKTNIQTYTHKQITHIHTAKYHITTMARWEKRRIYLREKRRRINPYSTHSTQFQFVQIFYLTFVYENTIQHIFNSRSTIELHGKYG